MDACSKVSTMDDKQMFPRLENISSLILRNASGTRFLGVTIHNMEWYGNR